MSKKRTLWTLLGIMMIATLIISACASATEAPTEAPPEEPEGMEFEGETVTIFTAAGEAQAAAFQAEFVDFMAETGIEVVVEGSPDFEVLSVTRAEAGDPPEIYNFPQPGLMASMTREGYLTDLNEALDANFLKLAYNEAWLSSGMVDGTLVGIWHNADVKSLVWYPKAEFEAAGYAIPETWDDLLALSDQ
ncbi:MAG TPA: ABC transporter substrate-binding protein, partial [Anaerolineales bacterium]|nr:ABC transporter substrate-binding protein [Anaerolineales bacterium]